MNTKDNAKALLENVHTPHYKTIEDLWRFINEHQELYIYGVSNVSSSIYDYLNAIGVLVKAFVVSDERIHNYSEWSDDEIPLISLSNVPPNRHTGFLLGLREIYYNDVIRNLRTHGFLDYFIFTEYDKIAICEKLQKPNLETFWFGFQVVDHCNLGCQMCYAFSQLSEEKYMDFDCYVKDIHRMRDLIGPSFSGLIHFTGGEPLLHPRIKEFVRVAYDLFPKASIFLFTNGIKLRDMDKGFWRTLEKCGVTLIHTTYPIQQDTKAIKDKADRFGVDLYAGLLLEDVNSASNDKTTKFPIDLRGSQQLGNFLCCYKFNTCIALKEGKLYTCDIIQNIHTFNKYFEKNLQVCDKDYLDIYKVKDFSELANFVTKSPSFCRYCDVKNRRKIGGWAQSKKTIDEYID
jgi:hypothetical protein